MERGTALGRGAILAAMVAALAGCNMRGGKIPYAPADFGAPDRNAEAAIDAYDIPIGPLDVVKISVFRVPDLTGEYQVDAHGNLDLPLIGTVSARRFRPDEFGKELERLYGARYLTKPDVTVRVMTTNQANVTIEGGVNAPGVYTLPGRTTLLGAIAIARGINTQDGNPKRVAIFRKRDGQTVAAAFDIVSIRHGDMADPVIYPGDTVVVDYAQLRSLYRDLLQALPTIAVFNSL
jgi:polysaccharide biosynthesis/export protein